MVRTKPLPAPERKICWEMSVPFTHLHVESDLSRFLSSVLQRTDQISQSKVDDEIVEQHVVVVDQTIRLLYSSETAVRILMLMTKKP